MILLLHVLIAVFGIMSTTYGYFKPTQNNLKVSYLFVVLTFVSGFYLVASEPAQMLRACMTGIAYLGIVSLGILATRKKLVALQDESI